MSWLIDFSHVIEAMVAYILEGRDGTMKLHNTDLKQETD